MKLFIRNMACASCILVVRSALKKFDLTPVRVELGEAEIKGRIDAPTKEGISKELRKAGLEIVENKNGIIIERIRQIAMQYVREPERPALNFSAYAEKELGYDYTYLSNLFSEVEAKSISQFINAYRMEVAKELILFEGLSLTEVADRLHYNNLSHFSAQFKKTTGLSPSHFKQLKSKRLTVQELL